MLFKMKQLSGALVFLSLLLDFSSEQAISCQSSSTFQITVGPVISCPTGYTCDASSNSPCVLDSSTTINNVVNTEYEEITSTTTTAPVKTTTTPAPTTTTTTTSVASTTAPLPTSTSAPVTTTVLTTTAATTTACPEGQTGTAPTCTTSGKNYPGPTCDQYYECITVWWWYEYRLRTCASGLTYSSSQEECVSTEGSCACVD